MPKYVFIYHAPMASADRTPLDPEAAAAMIGEWYAWAERVGGRMIDFGNPIMGGMRVTAEGVEPSVRDVAGYSLIEASSYAEAVELAKINPHLAMPGGSEIEVYEAHPLPSQ